MYTTDCVHCEYSKATAETKKEIYIEKVGNSEHENKNSTSLALAAKNRNISKCPTIICYIKIQRNVKTRKCYNAVYILRL